MMPALSKRCFLFGFRAPAASDAKPFCFVRASLELDDLLGRAALERWLEGYLPLF
jgi:hypothetical protein